ncbi:MAG: hypothetical protein AB1405_16920, partial [Bdellovibrionota bacterium]
VDITFHPKNTIPFAAAMRRPNQPPFWREWTHPTLAESAKKLYEQEVLAGPLLESCPECQTLLGKDVSLFSGLSGSRSLLRGKWLVVYKDNTPPYESVSP